jgi:hypothetical protein
MTKLRDARLRQAMDQAAVQPPWRRWLAARGGHRTPWAAGWLTVLAAGFITVLAPAAAAPLAPAAAAVAALRAAGPVVGPQLLPVPGNWTQVRIEAGADSIVLERAQAADLSRLLEQALRSPAQAPAPSAPVSLRFELAQGGESLGVLELAGEHWRWLSLRDVQQARSLQPEPAVDAALREEARRVLRR